MKLFSVQPEKMDKKTGLGVLMLNLVLPGLGSIFAGRKSGYLQLLLSLISLGATLNYGFKLLMWFYRKRAQVPDLFFELHPDIRNELLDLIKPLVYALCIFFIALVWSLITNYSIIKQAKKSK